MYRRGLRRLIPVLGLLIATTAMGAPGIELDKTRIDFGKIGQHQVLETEILIGNNGDANLEINEIYTSCPCTVLDLLQDIIPPGSSTILKVSFHSRDYEGRTDKVIEIYTNDPDHQFIEIPVGAFIRTPIRFEPPGRIIDFGELPRGETSSLAVELTGVDLPKLKVTPGEGVSDLFTVNIACRSGGDPAKVMVTLTLLATAEAGPFREILPLQTNVPGMETVDLEVRGDLKGELQPTPSSLNFRFVKSGQELAGEVEISSPESELEFKVTGAEVDLPGLDASVTPEGRVLVFGHAMAKDDPRAKGNRGRLKGTLTIHTDLVTEPRIKVDVLYILRK